MKRSGVGRRSRLVMDVGGRAELFREAMICSVQKSRQIYAPFLFTFMYCSNRRTIQRWRPQRSQ